jgi:hypothetical protein
VHSLPCTLLFPEGSQRSLVIGRSGIARARYFVKHSVRAPFYSLKGASAFPRCTLLFPKGSQRIPSLHPLFPKGSQRSLVIDRSCVARARYFVKHSLAAPFYSLKGSSAHKRLTEVLHCTCALLCKAFPRCTLLFPEGSQRLSVIDRSCIARARYFVKHSLAGPFYSLKGASAY